MKQIIRDAEPISFFKGEKKIEFYQDLRDDKGKIRDRWNLPTYKKDLVEVLLRMSRGECSFCGTKLGESNLDVEHYLPKEQFPYLSYCFENYLASCKPCNQNRKRSYYPRSLESRKDKLGESVLVGHIEGINIEAYNKQALLTNTSDRIIEPSFDNIQEHLEFSPETTNYRAKTNIGIETNRMFFNHSEVLIFLQKISSQVMKMIQEGSSKETILNWSDITGYSSFMSIGLIF
jgi:uncharacterized protein (TIGR02646 family)